MPTLLPPPSGGPARDNPETRVHRLSARRGRRRRWLRQALIGANIVVAMALVASITVLVYVDYRWGQVTKVHLPGLVHRGQDSAGPVVASPKATGASRGAVHASPGPAMTILLVGNNTRTGLDPSEASQFGSSAEVG